MFIHRFAQTKWLGALYTFYLKQRENFKSRTLIEILDITFETMPLK